MSKFFISLLSRNLWDFYANEHTFFLGLREGSLQFRSVLVSGSIISSPRTVMVSATYIDIAKGGFRSPWEEPEISTPSFLNTEEEGVFIKEFYPTPHQ